MYPRPIASLLKFATFATASKMERLLHPTPKHLSEIRNFLLLQYPLALGTAIHATPLIPSIHAAIPDAHIIAAASGFALQVLRDNPGLESLIATPNPLTDLQGAICGLRAAQPFHGEPYVAIQTTGNERSRIILAAMLSGAHTRVGFTIAPQLSAAPLNFDSRLSQIANNLRIIEALGHGPALMARLDGNPSLLEPTAYFSTLDLDAALTLLAEANPQSHPVTAFVLQGSGGQRTGWREERFIQVIRHVESLGHRTIFLGTAKDADSIQHLLSLAGSSGTSLAGRTTIPQLAALLCLCDLLVSLDTGTMHVGRAAGLPMVVLGPSWQKPIEWLPLGKPNVRILRGEDRDDVPPDYRLDEIEAPSVIAAIDDLQQAFPPSSQQREHRISRLLAAH